MPSSAWSSDVCRSEEHTSELQSLTNIVCRLLLENNTTTENKILSSDIGLTRRTSCDAGGPNWSLFFFNDTATTEIYTLSLHDALPISSRRRHTRLVSDWSSDVCSSDPHTSDLQSLTNLVCRLLLGVQTCADRKSTRLNSSH